MSRTARWVGVVAVALAVALLAGWWFAGRGTTDAPERPAEEAAEPATPVPTMVDEETEDRAARQSGGSPTVATTTPKPEASGAVVSGRLVFAETGAPAVDRTIRISQQEEVEERRTAESDAEGWFFIADVAEGRYRASLIDDELIVVPETAVFDVGGDRPAEGLVIQVARGGAVRGRVYDADSGAGIPGVEVRAWSFYRPAQALETSAVTDGDGRYEIAGLAPGNYEIQRRFARGYGMPLAGEGEGRDVVVRLGAVTGEVNFALSRGLRISGRVVDASGAPIADVQVYGASTGGSIAGNRGDPVVDATKTGEDGSFVLGGYAADARVNLLPEKAGYALLDADPAGALVELNDEALTGVRLVLGPEAAISGTVVTADGEPKAGVNMYAEHVSRPEDRKSRSTSSADGSITFDKLKPGRYRLMFSDVPGWRPDEAQVVRVREGEQVEGIRIVYPENRGLSISGRVTDVHGRALSEALVTVFGKGDTRTNAKGRYEVEELEARDYTIAVKMDGYSAIDRSQVPAGSTGVDFTLMELAAVEGRVVSASTGEPVTAFDLKHEVQSADFKRSYGFKQMRDPDGRFRFETDAGDVTVMVRAEGYAPAREAIGQVAPGRTKRDVIVRLTDGAVLAGRVTNRSGAPVGEASFSLAQGPVQETLGASNPDGSYRLTTVPPGPTILRVTPPGYAPAEIAVNLSPGTETRHDVVVRAGGVIEGRLMLGDNPHAFWPVYVTTSLNDRVEGRTDAKGHYRFENVPAGAATIEVFSYPGDPVSIDVVDGETFEVNFDR